MPKAVGRNSKTVFNTSNQPAYKNGLPQWPAFMLEMVIPGEGHKDVRNTEQNNGTHII